MSDSLLHPTDRLSPLLQFLIIYKVYINYMKSSYLNLGWLVLARGLVDEFEAFHVQCEEVAVEHYCYRVGPFD